jgi:hypothetical protein
MPAKKKAAAKPRAKKATRAKSRKRDVDAGVKSD